MGDVRKREDAQRVVEATVKHFGMLDILVNAAAGNFLVSAEDLSPNGFKTGSSLFTCPILARSTRRISNLVWFSDNLVKLQFL